MNPIITKTGPDNLLTDVAGLQVGCSEDEPLKSGVTVVTGDKPFATAVHVMGGAPGTRETELLEPDKLVSHVDALVLAGGSALGLDAAGAVANRLRAAGRGFQVGGQSVPIVPSAIIFDLLNGGDKNWEQNPYAALGERALEAASGHFQLGSAGAGYGALTPVLKGGLGSASLEISRPNERGSHAITVAALAVVNPVGSVTVGESAYFRAAQLERDGEFGSLGVAPVAECPDHFLPPRKPVPVTASGEHGNPGGARHGENTTLGIVATDADLDVAQLKRIATAAHDGIARAISPAHTPMDGDLIFALSTTHGYAGVESGNAAGARADSDLQLTIGHAAAECMSRAIARAVFEARPARGDLLPAWCEKLGSC